jgi:hypothetical protein
MSTQLARQRFIDTLRIVDRERRHLEYSCKKLFSANLTAEQLARLDDDPELAETIEAFASRFGRMQDTMAGKLFPRFLQAQAESTGTQLETLNRLEKLGLIDNVEQWLEARALRNRLIHEYVEKMDQFKHDLELAREYALMLAETHQRVGNYARRTLNIPV